MSLSDSTLFYKPNPEEHVIIRYSDENKLAELATTFFNEGLKLNQFCIYASMHLDNEILEKLSSKIKDYDKHIENENLLIVGLKPYYTAIMEQNLEPFNDLKKYVLEKKSKREDKPIRLWGDLVSYLFEQKHFDECVLLEQWWQENPLGGLIVCPYNRKFLDEPLYEKQKDMIIHEHEKTILCH